MQPLNKQNNIVKATKTCYKNRYNYLCVTNTENYVINAEYRMRIKQNTIPEINSINKKGNL